MKKASDRSSMVCSMVHYNHVKNEKNRQSHFGDKSKNTICQHLIPYNPVLRTVTSPKRTGPQLLDLKEKKIYLPIARYNKKIKNTIGLSEYDGIRKMLNINYKGKVPSKAAVAEN